MPHNPDNGESNKEPGLSSLTPEEEEEEDEEKKTGNILIGTQHLPSLCT